MRIRTITTAHSRYVLNYAEMTFTRERVAASASVLPSTDAGKARAFTSAEVIDGHLRILDTPSGYWLTSTKVMIDESVSE